jgi:methylated-DNA-[protein]-cysteine S-methyltransferase
MRRFISGRNSRKRSPKKKRRNQHDLFWQEDGIARQQTQIGRKLQSSGRRSLGAGTSEPSKTGTMNLDPQHPILIEAERQLSEYFAGKRTRFDLPLQPDGTEFQKKVWRALREIPFGKTKSYLDLARAISSPKASRAVGAANGKNPLSIVVPCHRVVGADGALTGFAGGLATKAALLTLEARR